MALRTFLRNNIFLTIFLGVLALLALYYIWLNRIPYTTNAFVVANVRPVAALVPGPITDIYVANNTAVREATPILTIDPRPYELAVARITNNLEAVAFEIEALHEATVKTEHLIEQRRAQYAYARYRSEIEKPLLAESFAPEYRGKMLVQNEEVQAAELRMAEAELAQIRAQLKSAQSRKKSLEAQVGEAEIRLQWTTVYARSDGIVSNMFLSVGTMVREGQELFAFVDTSRWWIQANFKETVLRHVRPGQRARLDFWLYSGKTFYGTVTDIGWNASRQLTGQYALPVVEKENEWFLLPQRFPVQIQLEAQDPNYPLHVGMSANVHIETGRWQWPSIR